MPILRLRARPGPRRAPLGLATTIAALLATLAACGGSDGSSVTPPPTNQDPPDPPAAEVQGEVTHGGAGVGSVQIFLRDGPGSDQELTTPNDGGFTFEDVEPGTWELEILPPDYFRLAAGHDAVRSIQVPEGGTLTVNVALEPVEELQVQVVEATADLDFVPGQLNVAPGTRIRWTNTSSVLHTVSPDGHGEWSEGTIASSGATFEAVVNNPGSFDYLCTPHYGNGMVGVVNVGQ